MKQPIIKYNSEDFEEDPYDPLFCLKYKGELFSGTLLYEDEKSYTEYKDGNVEGRHLRYYKNGQIACDCIYKENECVSQKRWYQNGQLRSDGVHLFDKNGNLIQVNDSWLYPNGAKRNGKGENEYYEFSTKGELAIKTIVNNSGDYKNTIVYYDDVLSNCYQDLFINYYPDEDQLFYNLEFKIWGWVMAKYLNNKDSGFDLLTKLANYENRHIAENAQLLLRKIAQKEIDPKAYLENISYYTILQ